MQRAQRCARGDPVLPLAPRLLGPRAAAPWPPTPTPDVPPPQVSLFTSAEKNGGTKGKVYLKLLGRRHAGGGGVAAADGGAPGAAAAATAAAGLVKSSLVCINSDGSALAE